MLNSNSYQCYNVGYCKKSNGMFLGFQYWNILITPTKSIGTSELWIFVGISIDCLFDTQQK